MNVETSLALRTSDPRAPRFALWLSSAGLEATYIYAWAAFALTLISQQRYSAMLAVLTFAGASLMARALASASLRFSELALLHGAGLTLVSLLSIHDALYSNTSLWRAGWLIDLVVGEKSAKAAVTTALALFFSWNLWIAGFRHGRAPATYQRVCARFDRGILWLAALFVLKLLWRGQRDANLDDGVSGSLIAPYFLFAMVALASARSRGMGVKSLIGGYRGLGRIANVSLRGVFLTLACVLLFLPELRTAAGLGYDALRELGGPLGSTFAFVLSVLLGLWMLVRGPHQAAPALKKQVVMVDPKPHYHDRAILPAHELPEWLLWSAGIALLAGLVIAMGYIAWRARGPAAASGSSILAKFWRWAKTWLQRVATLLTPAPPQPEPVRIYEALLLWGRRSGSPYRHSETPLEYACRLQQRLPVVHREIELIAMTYSAYAYGSSVRSTPECSHEKAALRRLRSLKLWPQRFRLWLTGDADLTPHATISVIGP